MCWKTNGRKPSSRKVMRSPITVYKVVYSSTDGIFSPFRDFRYHCPERYELGKDLELIKNKDTKYWEIEKGYHSYAVEDTIIVDGRVSAGVSLLMDYSMFRMASGIPMVMECKIPKLAKYYRNQNGEIVSDIIETVALHTEKQWYKRLEEIKKERHL